MKIFKSTFFFILCFFVISSIFYSKEEINDWLVSKGPYLGQKPPGLKAEIFAPGIVSTANYTEVLDVFLTNKEQIVFYRNLPCAPAGHPVFYTTLTTEIKNGKWTLPSPVIYFKGPNNPELSLIPDENIISFPHNRSIDGTKVSPNGFDIWVARKTKNGKYHIRWLGPKINSKKHDSWPSMTKDGTIYFYSDREGGMGGTDIFFTKLINGEYSKVESLGLPVNTKYNESDPYVARDGSYIVFCSGSPLRKGYGKGDLYITFKKKDGSWSETINMGKGINSVSSETRPMLTKDGKYIFFSRENGGTLDIYWVNTKIIEDLRPKELK